MVETDEFSCQSWLGRTLLDGVEEVIGRTGVYAITNLARMSGSDYPTDPDPHIRKPVHRDLVMIQRALEDMYGFRGGCGILMRTGRAVFKHILHQFGLLMGISDMEFRLLPAPARLKTGLEAMARQLAVLMDTRITLEERESKWLWRVEDCPFCYQRSSDDSLCAFSVGLLQEFLSWVSAGRVYSVWEVECAAIGHPACVIQIDKQPLD